MTYYNCHTYGNSYRITKFDKDLNVESTYEVGAHGCSCPAGHKECRHRPMLENFILTDHVDTDWFLDYDSGYWARPVSPIMTGTLRRPS